MLLDNGDKLMTVEALVANLRRFLLLMAMLVLLSALAELWLVDHTQETLQLLPFFLCGIGILSTGAALIRPQRSTLLVLRILMLLVAAGGVVGIALHLINNLAFEQEIRPNATTSDVLMAGLKGANPLLAPGVLVFAALLAIAATYYHPALRMSSEN
jgi:hypothetical protein